MRTCLHMLAITFRCHDGGRRRHMTPRRHSDRSGMGRRPWLAGLAMLVACLCTAHAHAEDGHDLWLRYRALAAVPAGIDRAQPLQLIAGQDSPTAKAARGELVRGLDGLLGKAPQLSDAVSRDGALIVGTPASSTVVAGLHLDTREL